MTACAVITSERTIDADAIARYRKKVLIAREKHPLTPIASYGRHKALEGDGVEGVAILSFPTMAAGTRLVLQPGVPGRITPSFSGQRLPRDP